MLLILSRHTRIFGGWKAIVAWDATLLALALAAGIGVIFGGGPAVKAAALEPIEALRTE